MPILALIDIDCDANLASEKFQKLILFGNSYGLAKEYLGEFLKIQRSQFNTFQKFLM
jgi:hypothetical protein